MMAPGGHRFPSDDERRAGAPPTLREWLAEAPFGLSLSAGFFGFFAHCGVLTVLEDEGLLPARLSGASAGALVAGLWAGGLDAARIRDELARLRREDFWDPAPGPGLLRGRRFGKRLRELLPVSTVERCRVPLALSAFDLLTRSTRVLDRGDLASAIHASCAVPLLFHPVWIDGRPALDGGIRDRAALAGMPAGQRLLLHFLTSCSPWRRRDDPQLRIPGGRFLRALALDGLPRVGPFHLERGRLALEQAQRATRIALDRPASDVVRVPARGGE